jgi:hypothetical protein
MQNNATAEQLTSVMKELGARTTVPSLWVWSENDETLGIAGARRWHDAYVAAGASAEFVAMPQGGGHALFTDRAGRNYWLKALDEFLQHRGLPTWSPSLVDEVMAKGGIAEAHRSIIISYLSAITHKVLVVDQATAKPYWHSLRNIDIGAVRKIVMYDCERQANSHCVFVMENFRFVPSTLDPTATNK